MSQAKRLLTKCDIDGMTAGILLKEMNLVEGVLFCQPGDVATGLVPVTGNDITAGLPCKESAYLAFDHYQDAGSAREMGNVVVDTGMRSTSRVIYNHFGASRFGRLPSGLLPVVDQAVSSDVTLDDILYPTGWMLLAHLIDQRTGLERYGRFSLATERLIETLMDWCREYTVWEVLNLAPVEERCACYFACADAYKSQILRCAAVRKNLVIVDLRNEEIVYPGNRFMVYAMFPECNVSLEITRSRGGTKTMMVAGKSFLDRSFNTHIGNVMRQYGGAGHRNAGTCEVDNDRVDGVRQDLIAAFKYGSFENLIKGYHNYYYT